jgi:hypothetical protein
LGAGSELRCFFGIAADFRFIKWLGMRAFSVTRVS